MRVLCFLALCTPSQHHSAMKTKPDWQSEIDDLRVQRDLAPRRYSAAQRKKMREDYRREVERSRWARPASHTPTDMHEH